MICSSLNRFFTSNLLHRDVTPIFRSQLELE
jgi:hypothetical protein